MTPLGAHLFFAACTGSLGLAAQVTFGPMHTVSEAYHQLLAPALHDMDHDGDIDILTVTLDSGLVWHSNDGFGNFSGTVVIEPGVYPPWNMQTGPLLLDVDNDGDADIVTAEQDHVSWWPDNGAGNFGPATLLFNGIMSDLHAAKLDEDDYTDLIGMSGWWGTTTWYRNDGQGTFIAQELDTAGVDWLGGCHDVNSDGLMDFVRADSVYLRWYRNTGAGQFDTLASLAEAPHGQWAYALGAFLMGDLDSDGDQDLVTQDTGLPYTSTVLENDGQQQFTPTQTLDVYPLLGPVLHDLDVDGDLDIIYSNGTVVGWHANDGFGNFAPQDTVYDIPPGDIGNWFSSTSMADLDGDGYDDVVATFQRMMPPPQNMTLAWIPVYPNSTAAPATADPPPGTPLLYPNPLVDLATLCFPQPLEHPASARLMDAQGRLIRHWTLAGGRTFTVERRAMVAGIYELQVVLANGSAKGLRVLVR